MLIFVIAFLVGDLYLQSFSKLPSSFIIVIAVCLSFVLFVTLRNYQRGLFLLFSCTLGFAFTYWYATTHLAWTLSKDNEGKPMLVTGYVASLPVIDHWQTSFLFALENEKSLIKLSSRDDMHLSVGDKRQFLVRLKRIHGTQNPGEFDYEAWALQKGLRATGYVIKSKQNSLLSHSWYRYPIDQLRQQLQKRILTNLPKSPTAPWLIALIIGERTGIAQQDWQVLRNTGTNHLMAIAGLHIGIIAGFAHTLVTWLWRRNTYLTLRLPAPLAGACAALMTAVIYSALAGFSIPTQRACLMLSVFITTLLLRRKINVWSSWSIALLIVILLNPLSVLTESFWLSFGTIALIIYGMSGRLAPSGFWWKWGRVQWVIGFGLIPLTLTLFQECSLVSFAANCIAIPWLGLFILPFCFLSGVFLFISPLIGKCLLIIADKSLSGMWFVLTWFSHLNFSSWHQYVPNYVLLLLTIAGFLFLLFPRGMPGRWLGVLWALPLALYVPAKPKPGDVWLSLLDVGQGLSVVVQTNNHTLVYDTGPKFNENFDMGASVVVPYLRVIGAKKIDMLVISHGDNDHIGGAQAVMHAVSVLATKTSVPEKLPSSSTSYCLAGQSWEWDKVKFTFLYPDAGNLQLGNDSSCVLLIDNGGKRILLTGDIEKSSEKSLLSTSSDKLPADILVAPHHGSKTSGVRDFVNTVHPAYVLYATGYRNRYHFPHQSVMASYKELNAIQLNTADTGMMLFKLESDNASLQPWLYRIENKHYWF